MIKIEILRLDLEYIIGLIEEEIRKSNSMSVMRSYFKLLDYLEEELYKDKL